MLSTKINYNPDVLNCLANLSNDEVFTPPDIVNQMLDLLPQELFSSPDTTFLDPASKSGVFLREIAKRLLKGLETQIPDLQERIDHIYKKQIFGIAITELTSLLSRRTLYCSKYPNSKYSVTKFESAEGNIRFRETKHEWKNDRCVFCGANKANYDREETLESHAYEFIHTRNPEELWNMKFDVIIGNPPYQMSDGGAGSSAKPIYHLFVEQAMKLQPRYLCMIIPARWYAGGKGLDEFRNNMLNEERIKEIHDFQIGADCFPGTRIAGGVCYFLWEKEYKDDCEVFEHNGSNILTRMKRPLLEKGADTFIRLNRAITILRKVQGHNQESFSTIVSKRKPFGLSTDFFADPAKYDLPQISENLIQDGITIYGTYKYKTVKRYVNNDYPFPNGEDKIDSYKVFVSQVLDNGFDWTKERLKPFLGLPKEVCTETFLTVGNFENVETAQNIISYMNTKFFHLLMFLKKVSHHVTSKVYQFVPMQDFSEPWTDEKLYKKYGLNEEEIAFIESMIRPMDSSEEK